MGAGTSWDAHDHHSQFPATAPQPASPYLSGWWYFFSGGGTGGFFSCINNEEILIYLFVVWLFGEAIANHVSKEHKSMKQSPEEVKHLLQAFWGNAFLVHLKSYSFTWFTHIHTHTYTKSKNKTNEQKTKTVLPINIMRFSYTLNMPGLKQDLPAYSIILYI